ncbi:MAG TPA: GAF domain-containing protein, partial [Thermomicrobiales bacterium]
MAMNVDRATATPNDDYDTATCPNLTEALTILTEGATQIGLASQGIASVPPAERLGALAAPVLQLLRDRLRFDVAWIVIGETIAAPRFLRCITGPRFAHRNTATLTHAIEPMLANLDVPDHGTLPPRLWHAGAMDTEHAPVSAELIAGLGLQALFLVPLLPRQEQNRAVGVIIAGTCSTALAQPEVLQLLGLIGAQLGTAIGHSEGVERLRLSEERARVVMEEATDGIYVVDQRGYFTYVNPQTERYLGYSSAQLVGQHFSAFVSEGNTPGAQFSLDQAHGGEPDEAIYDLDLRRSDGVVRTFEINGRNLHDPHTGTFIGRFGIARDITERRQLESELARRTRALEALNAIATLAGRASNLDAILNEALDRTLAVFHLEQGAICLLDRDARELALAAHRGYDQRFTARLARLRADTPLAELLLNAEHPLIGNDLPRDVPVLAEAASAAGIGKYGCVPLRSQERTLGVLIVSGPDGRSLSPSDGDTLAIVGAQLGAAIENARLAAEATASRAGLEAKTAQLSRLLTVSAGFAANMPIDAMLNTIATAIVETLGFGSAHVRARDEDGTTLTGIGFCGYDDNQRERLQNATPIAFYDRLLAPRFRLGGIQYIPHDIDRRATFGGDWSVVRQPTPISWQPGQWHPEDALIVPLRGRDGSLLGVIYVDEPLDGRVPDLEKAAMLELFGRQAALAIENADLYAQIQRDLRRQKALREVIEHVSGELDLDRLLEQLLADAVDLLGGDAGAFGLFDRDRGTSRIGTINTMPDNILSAVINAGQGADSPLIAISRPTVAAGGQGAETVIHASLGVPVIQGDKLVGTFFVGSTDPTRRFGKRDVETLELFAKHAALALGNAHLYEEARAQTARLETLREAIEQISSELDLPVLLNRLATSTIRLLDADSGMIALMDEEAGDLRIEAGFNLPPQMIGQRLAPREWLGNREGKQPGPLLIDANDPLPPDLLPSHTPGHAHIAAPIWWQNRLIGIFSLSSARAEKRFSQTDLETLVLLARHAAVAIENAGLYTALQERFSQVEGISTVGAALVEERDLDQVLSTVAAQIIELLGADGCSIFLLPSEVTQDDEGAELSLAVALGVGSESFKGRKLPLHGSLTGSAILERLPRLEADLLAGPADRAPALRDVGIDSLLSVPLQTSR